MTNSKANPAQSLLPVNDRSSTTLKSITFCNCNRLLTNYENLNNWHNRTIWAKLFLSFLFTLMGVFYIKAYSQYFGCG